MDRAYVLEIKIIAIKEFIILFCSITKIHK